MKILQVSDLHLGKRIYEYSLIEEQKDMLKKVLCIAKKEDIGAIIIAGDIYDKSLPSAEAVSVFDWFLAELSKEKKPMFIISGNHDSPERIAFGGEIMKNSGIYLSPVYNGEVSPIKMQDQFGEICVYMLPFIKPLHVKRFYPEQEINSYTNAVKVAVSAMNIDKTARNILISHQFVTGATRSESEETVGGLDNVDSEVLSIFDFVALGHLHKRQFIGGEKIHYSGTPLKYSFAEINDEKGVSIIEILDKENGVKTEFIPIVPIRDMREIKGSFASVIEKGLTLSNKEREDFYRIILTDENDVPDAMVRLKAVYKNALCLSYDNARTKNSSTIFGESERQKTTMELFEEFYKIQNNLEMIDVQKDYISGVIEETEGGEI